MTPRKWRAQAMYKYLVLFVLSMPLIGIWLVERGDFAMSIGVAGEANGATEAFAAFAGLLVLVALLTARDSRGPSDVHMQSVTPPDVLSSRQFTVFSNRLLLLSTVFLLTMLFGFGGFDVWLGKVEKGVFRATLGPFGALPYLMTKFAVPALFAYSTLLLMQAQPSSRNRRLWGVNAILVFICGSTWGFKTTGLFMLLPGLMVMNWKLPLYRLLVFLGAFFAALMLFFYWFDAQVMEDVEVVAFLGTRLTILQGDVAWYVWGLYRDGEALPNYWPTLLAAVGDTVLSGLGVSKTNLTEWMGYHYDWMLTFLSGSSLETIASGHSVTGTPFAEGVIAGGWFGVALFAVIGGLLVGRTYRYLDRAIRAHRNTTAALLSTYFCFHIFSWLNGGAITQLFHVSIVVYLWATYALLRVMSVRRAAGAARSGPHPLLIGVKPA
jgi:hypothetical protein